jgi:uncharacterized protein (TIGR03435 family)
LVAPLRLEKYMKPVALLFMFAMAAMPATSQTTAPKPSFEVASIKPHKGDVTFSVDPALRGSRVVGTASTLADMITVAYDVRYDQTSNGPGWINSDRFDIEAKAPGDVPPTNEQFRLMMQDLLSERFQLRLHHETRDLPVYALVVGKNGAKLKVSDPDAREGGSVRSRAEGLHMETKKGSMAALARRLSSSAGRPVIDKTGLTGTYEYTLDWFPATQIPTPESTVPSLFIAVQEQLGLRLDSTTAPQEVLVIDSVQRPSEN